MSMWGVLLGLTAMVVVPALFVGFAIAVPLMSGLAAYRFAGQFTEALLVRTGLGTFMAVAVPLALGSLVPLVLDTQDFAYSLLGGPAFGVTRAPLIVLGLDDANSGDIPMPAIGAFLSFVIVWLASSLVLYVKKLR